MNRLKNFLVILILISGYAKINCQNRGTVIDDYVPSEGIKQNIFGDTANPKIKVYLPPSYYNSDKRYPVLYFLTGSFTEVDEMFSGAAKGMVLNESLDTLIFEGRIREMIVVIATAKLNLNKSGTRMPVFYVNSPIVGNWEDFIAIDLISYIDSKYRTIPKPIARGICGHSLGGYGTIRFAMLHPDKFGYAYSLAYGGFKEPITGGFEDGSKPEGEKNTYRWNKLYELKKNCEHATYEEGMELFFETAKDIKMLWPLAMGTSLLPRFDSVPPFFYIPYKMVNDAVVYDAQEFDKCKYNYDLYHDSLIVSYTKIKHKKLVRLTTEVGLYDGQGFIDGCNYFSYQF